MPRHCDTSTPCGVGALPALPPVSEMIHFFHICQLHRSFFFCHVCFSYFPSIIHLPANSIPSNVSSAQSLIQSVTPTLFTRCNHPSSGAFALQLKPRSYTSSAIMDLAQSLIRSVARAFYETRQILVIDALMIHSA